MGEVLGKNLQGMLAGCNFGRQRDVPNVCLPRGIPTGFRRLQVGYAQTNATSVGIALDPDLNRITRPID